MSFNCPVSSSSSSSSVLAYSLLTLLVLANTCYTTIAHSPPPFLWPTSVLTSLVSFVHHLHRCNSSTAALLPFDFSSSLFSILGYNLTLDLSLRIRAPLTQTFTNPLLFQSTKTPLLACPSSIRSHHSFDPPTASTSPINKQPTTIHPRLLQSLRQ